MEIILVQNDCVVTIILVEFMIIKILVLKDSDYLDLNFALAPPQI